MSYTCKGNERAFNELYRRFSKPLYLFFYNRLWQDHSRAEDFLQDLFLKVIEKSESFDRNRKFKIWLFTIANNMCKNEYRSREKEILKHDFIGGNDDKFIYTEPETTSRALDYNGFSKHLQIELSKLDNKYSSAFILRHQFDFSIKEIAEIMRCPEGTVKSRLSYGIKILAKRLRNYKTSLKEQ